MALTARQLTEYWYAYKVHQDESSRDALIEAYLPLVKRTVNRVKALLPPSIEDGDLLSYGVIGLMEAVDRFDEQRGVPFEAYAIRRIRGAIVDGLRAMGWVPRSAYQKAKHLQETFEILEQRLGHTPSEQELAQEMGMDDEEYSAFVMDAAPVTVLSLEDLVRMVKKEEDTRLLEEERRGELVEVLSKAIEQLPEKEKLVISLYFYEQLTLKEISKILHITEGRVCQLKTQAITRLKVALKRLAW